jgi:hypothetical protein
MAISNPREVIRLHASDLVGVALCDLRPGAMMTVDGQMVRVADPVPLGHKIALVPIAKGKRMRKYGQTSA